MHVAKMQRARPPSRYRWTRVFIYVRSVRGCECDVHRSDINENMSLSIALTKNPAVLCSVKGKRHSNNWPFESPIFRDKRKSLVIACTLNDIYVRSTFTNTRTKSKINFHFLSNLIFTNSYILSLFLFITYLYIYLSIKLSSSPHIYHLLTFIFQIYILKFNTQI